MACSPSSSVAVFDHAWLSTRTSMAATSTSNPVPSQGNRVVANITVINISASSTANWYLDGSLDGKTWQQLATVAQSSFGVNVSLLKASLDTPFVRVRVALTGTDVDMLFSVALAFSSQ